MVLTRLSALGANVDGDAPVAAPVLTPAPGGHLPQGERTRPLDTAQPPHRNAVLRQRQDHAQPSQQQTRLAATIYDANGNATTNRRGLTLCTAYVSGSCTTHNCPMAHQCPRCLGDRNACTTPGSCSHQKGQQKGRKGKGKGKGKNKK